MIKNYSFCEVFRHDQIIIRPVLKHFLPNNMIGTHREMCNAFPLVLHTVMGSTSFE